MESFAAELSAALVQHKAGNAPAAEAIYRSILNRAPKHADAWHLLGVLANQAGRADAAIDCIGRALKLAGSHPLMHYNLACALLKQGKLPEAVAAFDEALALRPEFADAHVNRAVALMDLGRLPESRQGFQQALLYQPDHVDAHFSLARVLERLQDSDGARRHYYCVLYAQPRHVAALNNLGVVLQNHREYARAAECFEQALEVQPGCLQALTNLATAREAQGNHAAAASCFERIIAIDADDVQMREGLARTLAAQGDLPAARTHYQHAARLQPDNLLAALRVATLMPQVPASCEEIDTGRQQLIETLESLISRTRKGSGANAVDALPFSSAKPPVAMTYQGGNDLPIKRLFAKLFESWLGPQPRMAPQAADQPHVGFVVSGGNEGVFKRGMAGMIRRLRPGSMRITIACAEQARADLSMAIGRDDVQFLPLARRFSDTIAVLRAARLDLLYHWEVGTDCVNYFLPFFRVAAVQCTSWAWPVTTGMSAMDYFISSRHLEPRAADQHYSEQLLRTEHLPNYYEPPQIQPARRTRAELGFSAADHLYLCAQNPRKIHPDFDQLVGAILQNDPRARCLFMESSRAYVTRQLQSRLAGAVGPRLAQRIQFLPRRGQAEYLALMNAADVLLDTVHYGGGANTTYDALALGLPVVTLPTEFHRGRYAMAAYRVMGMDDCIAYSPAEYVQIALRVANDAAWRRHLSQRIVESREQLFNNQAAVQELESVLLHAARGGSH